MVSDLFSHVLATISVELNLNLLNITQVQKVKVSSHFSRREAFSSETFAYLELEMRDFQGAPVQVTGSVGKGVGNEQAKELVFDGRKGLIKFDLRPGVERDERKVSIREIHSSHYDKLFDVASGHAEFLECLLKGEFAKNPVGGLTPDQAKHMIDILHGIHNRIERCAAKIPQYRLGASEDEIRNDALEVAV